MAYFIASQINHHTIKVKNSKFHGVLAAVFNQTDVNAILHDVKKQYPKASHYCYAYTLGLHEPIEKANDDGEPSNTAGKPILGQLHSFSLANSLLIIVRYFGGVKLGASGLIAAYKQTAKETIETATLTEFFNITQASILFEYEKMHDVMQILNTVDAEIIEHQSSSLYQIIFRIKEDNVIKVEKQLSNFGRFNIISEMK